MVVTISNSFKFLKVIPKQICSLLLIMCILGFPRIYGSEIPIAVILIPFFLKDLFGFYNSNLKLVQRAIAVFSMFVCLGFVTAFFGDGSRADYFFHLIQSGKIFLNLVFGIILFQIVKTSIFPLVVWVLIQLVLMVLSAFYPSVYFLLLEFISPRAVEVFSNIFGSRTLGFGILHMDGGYVLTGVVFFLAIFSYKKIINWLWFLLPLIAMSLSRSVVIPYVIYTLILPYKKIRYSFVAAVVLMMGIGPFLPSGPFYEGTALFRYASSKIFNKLNAYILDDSVSASLLKSIEDGDAKGSFGATEGNTGIRSVRHTAEMYIFPRKISTLVIGDGKYFDQSKVGMVFYNNTDVGYLRLIYFGGIFYMFLFLFINIQFLNPIIFRENFSWNQLKGLPQKLAIGIIVVFVIYNAKGIQTTSIFSTLAFCLWRHWGGSSVVPKANSQIT